MPLFLLPEQCAHIAPFPATMDPVERVPDPLPSIARRMLPTSSGEKDREDAFFEAVLGGFASLTGPVLLPGMSPPVEGGFWPSGLPRMLNGTPVVPRCKVRSDVPGDRPRGRG